MDEDQLELLEEKIMSNVDIELKNISNVSDKKELLSMLMDSINNTYQDLKKDK